MVDRAWSTLLAGPPPQKSFGKLTNWDKLQYGDSMRPTLPPISTLASEMGGTPRTLRAAQRWDETQKQRQGRAERLYQAMERSGSAACLRTPTSFNRSLQDIRTSRIWVREEAPPPKPIERKVVVVQAAPDHEVVGEEWSLPVSIWAPRRASADSRDFHDTDALRQQCLDMDWKLALADHNTKAYIEELERSTPESVEAVYQVLRDVYPLVIGIYDYYCTLGPAGDDNVVEISQYGYKKLLEDTCLVVPGSKFSSSTAFDQLLKLVNAQTENVRAPNCQKWLHMYVYYTTHTHTQGMRTHAHACARVYACLRKGARAQPSEVAPAPHPHCWLSLCPHRAHAQGRQRRGQGRRGRVRGHSDHP